MKKNVQLNHQNHKSNNIKFPLSLIANNVSDPRNVGSLFRLSDSLGINKLYLCGDTSLPPNSKINKTARATIKHVTYESHSDASELIQNLKSSDVFIVSLEITSSSIAIDSQQFLKMLDQKKSIYLILGSEQIGVDENLLALSDATVHIPMYGNNSSMNIVSAASIACFEITQQMKASGETSALST